MAPILARMHRGRLARKYQFTGTIDDEDPMPEFLIAWLLAATGAVACLAATIALLAAKGGDLHRLAGRVFFWSMLAAVACVVWTSLSANRNLILLLALLSGYLVISGYRVLYLKRLAPRDIMGPTRAGALDKGLAQFILIACSAISAWGMMAVPLNVAALGSLGHEPILMIGIGLSGAMLALGDMRRFRRPAADPHSWLTIHLTRMLAGSTAAMIVASLEFLTMIPEHWRWFVPALVGALVITFAAATMKRRIKREGNPRAFLTVRIAEPEPDQDAF
jgi:hypothetical protein